MVFSDAGSEFDEYEDPGPYDVDELALYQPGFFADDSDFDPWDLIQYVPYSYYPEGTFIYPAVPGLIPNLTDPYYGVWWGEHLAWVNEWADDYDPDFVNDDVEDHYFDEGVDSESSPEDVVYDEDGEPVFVFPRHAPRRRMRSRSPSVERKRRRGG
jgi:hypothetical protein